MKKEYDQFILFEDVGEMPEGEVNITVRELTPDDHRKKYLARYVKAKVSSDPDKMPEGDVLWLRWQRGRLYPKPWAIKIMEELSEYPKK